MYVTARCDILIAGASLPLQTSSSYSVQARSVFLIPGDLPAGLLFGIKAVFVDNVSPVTLQVWRPTTANVTSNFTLVAQYPPLVFNGQLRTEQQYNLTSFALTSSNATQNVTCVQVNAGDRLGIYFDTHGSIAYYFNTDVLKISYLEPSNTAPYQAAFTIGQQTTFNQLVFPYQFQITAYIDTVTTAACNSLEIPVNEAFTKVEMTTIGVTGPPGPVGATGAAGSPGGVGATGATGLQGPPGSQGAKGAAGPVGPIGLSGPIGAPGQAGDKGATGPIGPPGPTGSTGETGPVGDAGPPGPTGERGLDLAPSKSSLNQESFVTGMIIWAAILSFIVILLFIFLIILCCCHCRLERRRKEEREEAAKARAERQAQGPRSPANVAYLRPAGDEFDASARKQSLPEFDASRQQQQNAGFFNAGYDEPTPQNGSGARTSGAYHTEPMHDSREDADNDGTYVGTMRGEEEQVYQNESINREPSHKGRPIGMSRTADGNTDEML